MAEALDGDICLGQTLLLNLVERLEPRLRG